MVTLPDERAPHLITGHDFLQLSQGLGFSHGLLKNQCFNKTNLMRNGLFDERIERFATQITEHFSAALRRRPYVALRKTAGNGRAGARWRHGHTRRRNRNFHGLN